MVEGFERFEKFTALVNKIEKNIKKLKKSEMANYKLKSPHVSCLYYLYSFKGLTATELCERCNEDKATISRSLRYLEENSYLVCKSSAKKRYNSLFELTERGEQAGKRISDKVYAILSEMNAEISEKERETLYKCLGVINRNIDKAVKAYQA